MFQKAKIFNNGNSQAVRLPKEFRFEGKEVIVRKVENGVLLMPQNKNFNDFFSKRKIQTI
ncbi:antitoxin [Brachyspira sp.]|uniref:antitoxin n=1 Tax=Brachyspira sp. TaxID=1977261 RepID=UPI003D7D79F9